MSNKPVNLFGRTSNKSITNLPSTASESTPTFAPDSLIALTLTLDQIEPYAGNPRRVENPAYYEIRESIRRVGLRQPLTVSQRPDSDKYTLVFGGNTRLKILRELYDQTGDFRFHHITCTLTPWAGDADVLINHMIENEQRGSMTMIDKARAAVQFQHLWQHDHNGEILSGNKLTEVLQNRGWTISQPKVSAFLYAIEHLEPVIPTCLNFGLGISKVNELRRHANAIKMVLDHFAYPDCNTTDGLALWYSTLSAHDDPEFFEIPTVLRAYGQQLGSRVNVRGSALESEVAYVIRHGEVFDGTQYVKVTPCVESTPETTDTDNESPAEEKPDVPPEPLISRDDYHTTLNTLFENPTFTQLFERQTSAPHFRLRRGIRAALD